MSITQPINWRASLPYETDKDGQRMLEEIKVGMANAAAIGDFAPGCVKWAKRLNRYVELKYPLTIDERAQFALLLYELIITPDMDANCMLVFIPLGMKLMNKKHLPSDRLTLQWRPLYAIIEKYARGHRSKKLPIQSATVGGEVAAYVGQAKRFFPPETTAEVLEKFIPYLNANQAANFPGTRSQLALFLPRDNPPPMPEELKVTPSTPPFYWIPTMFSLWSLSRLSSTEMTIFVDLLAKLAEAHIHSPSNLGWTEEQIRFVFSAGLGVMNLPVGSGMNGSTNGGHSGLSGILASLGDMMSGGMESFGQKFAVDPFASFIVWTIFPEWEDMEGGDVPPPPKTKSMAHLAEMIQAIESYYHPSNYGRWTSVLTRLLQSLSYQFLKRVRLEEQPDCKTPQQYRITPAMRKEFVTLLRPVVYLSMFGKDPSSVSCTHAAIKYLAWIEPRSIIPGLLDRIYPALETLTESHRTLSCLGALHNIAFPLLNRKHYPEGGRHLPALLDLALPGIDVNDPIKTSITLLFIRHALACVPIVDLTKRGSGNGGVGYMEVDNAEGVNLEEEDEECRLGTAVFEDFVGKFLERIFVMFENLPQQHGNVKNNRDTESSVISIVMFACKQIFMQMSPSIQAIALRKIQNSISDNVIPNATKAIGMLCSITGSPSSRLSTFMPLCHTAILTELSHGASTDPFPSSEFPFGFAAMSDARLHWYQCILHNMVMRSGGEVLKYKGEAVELLRAMIGENGCKSRTGWKWGGKFLTAMLQSLTRVYPMEMRCVGKSRWEDDDYINNSHKSWGECGDTSNLDIDWHMPTEKEKVFAVELMDEFVPLALKHLQALVNEVRNGSGKDKRELSAEFQRWFGLLRYSLEGMACLVPPGEGNGNGMGVDQQEGDENEDEDEARDERKPITAGYCFEDPQSPQYQHIQSLRTQISTSLLETHKFFRTHLEDDTEPILSLLQCTTLLLCDRGCTRMAYDSHARWYEYDKAMITVGKDVPQEVPRFLAVDRVWVVHHDRLWYNSYVQKIDGGGVVEELVGEVLGWSVGRYSGVRKEAQKVLSDLVRCFGTLKKGVFWKVVKVLGEKGEGKEEEEEERRWDRIKGALYILSKGVMLGMELKEYKLLRGVLVALAGCVGAEKKSIQKRWSILAKELVTRYHEIGIGLQVSESVGAAAKAIVGGGIDEGRVVNGKRRVTRKAERSREEYNGMIQDLLEALNQPTIPVSYRTMIINFLELAIRESEPVPASLTRFALEKVNSEELSVRTIGLKLLKEILWIVKTRAKEGGGAPNKECKKVIGVEEVLGGHTTEEWLSRGVKGVEGEKQWREAVFVDDLAVGWLCWPKKVKIRHGGPDMSEGKALYHDPTSEDTMRVLVETMNSKEFWETFLKYRTEETSTKLNAREAASGIGPVERFGRSEGEFYERVFCVLGDGPLQVLKEMVRELAGSSEKREQRACVEVLSGVLRGSRYWGFGMIKGVWEWVVAVLDVAMERIDPEAVAIWSAGLGFGLARQDPRRHLPIINYILCQRFDPSSQSFFTESKKLGMIRLILQSFHWRINSLTEPLLNTYIGALRNPYEQVRGSLGSCLQGLLVSSRWVGLRDVEEVVGRRVQIREDEVGLKAVERMVAELKGLREGAKSEEEEKDEYKNAGMTVISMLSIALISPYVAAFYPYLPLLIPEILQMQVYGDQDLQNRAQNLSQIYSNLPHPDTMVEDSIAMLLDAVTSETSATNASNSYTKWQVRWRVLPMLQVFYFRHLFLMSEAIAGRVVEGVAGMLEDGVVEVRILAGVTLSGFIRCSQREAVLGLKKRFEEALSTTKLPRRRRTDAQSESSKQTPEYQKILLRRHAAVLGLSALVQAFPYEVPAWMPEVLVLLSGCVGDPAPVGASVQKTFADFRRTHQDNWHEDMLVFTEEQRESLTDLLISPSYYA